MNSQQIEYVLTLAQEHSFSKAAQKLYVTQPSLSQYIMNIEKQLGAVLFDRSSNPVRLTQEGEVYVAAALEIKSIEDNLKNRLSDMSGGGIGSLKIGATSFRAACLLSRSISEFCKKMPGVEVTVSEDKTSALLNMVKNGELDVALVSGNVDEKIFHCENLADEKMYLAVGNSNPLNDTLADFRLQSEDIISGNLKYLMSKPIDMTLLKNEKFVYLNSDEFGDGLIDSLCGFKPKIAISVRGVETMFAFVNSCFGAAFVPDTLIRFGNYSKHPCYYRVDGEKAGNKISLVSRRNGYFSSAAKEYCLLLRQLVAIGTWRISGDNEQ